MRFFILYLLLSSFLSAQEFVVHISKSETSQNGKIVYDPQSIIRSKYKHNIDPGIIIPDTVRYKADPEMSFNVSTGHSKLGIEVYVVHKNEHGHDELKKAESDDLLKFSNLVSKSRPPKESGYFIFINNKWAPYNYSE